MEDDGKVGRYLVFREAAAVYDAGHRTSLRAIRGGRDEDEPAVSAADFKARCLALMDEVAETGKEVVVTKRGKPVAKLVPYAAPQPVDLRGSLVFEAPNAWEPDADAWAESAWTLPGEPTPNEPR